MSRKIKAKRKYQENIKINDFERIYLLIKNFLSFFLFFSLCYDFCLMFYKHKLYNGKLSLQIKSKYEKIEASGVSMEKDLTNRIAFAPD